ncbi:glycosyltransferase family 2 protein [Roseomonas sp. CAU 1739]|uniref:glycosyltransferase family 2 protein n=1 Tax=Roseomonas sp. CAU 1739 TaxID=3140364 RepID=UPI00325B7D4F
MTDATAPTPEFLVAVIPAYQEAATIADVVTRLRGTVPGLAVLVVDDGSSDGTAGIAAAAGALVLGGAANQGKGAALRLGMRAALTREAGFVATLDGDGQHRPEDLPRLLALAAPDRIVIGSRRGAPGQPAARRRANRVADFWISWAARHPVADSQSGFRIYPAAALADLARYEGRARGFSFESEILIDAARAGITTAAADIPALYGAALRRASHFRPVADIARIVIMVAGKLLARGMDPVGLWRSLRPPGQEKRDAPST